MVTAGYPRVKFPFPGADWVSVYRCFHCGDLHFSSDQGRRCSKLPHGPDGTPPPVASKLPWRIKRRLRGEYKRTPSEWRLWRSLQKLLPLNMIESQWWVPETDFYVDFYFELGGLVVEVDGSSHEGREEEDYRRSLTIRSLGYEVARVTADDVMANPDRVAAKIAFRIDQQAARDLRTVAA